MSADQEQVAAFVNELLYKCHNTEQQRVFKLVYALIKGMAAKDRFIDLRNQASKDFCDDVIKTLPPYNFPFI
jgi:hypothetical protein